MFFVDVLAIEASLYFGYLIRSALAAWWPVTLGPGTYEGLIPGVLVVPVAYYLVGLHPGYGLGSIEHFRRRMTVTISVFAMLLVWDYIAQSGAWSRGIILATFVVALGLTLARAFLIRKHLWGLPVLLIGTGVQGVTLARILRDEPALGYMPIGFLERSSVSDATEVSHANGDPHHAQKRPQRLRPYGQRSAVSAHSHGAGTDPIPEPLGVHAGPQRNSGARAAAEPAASP
jgi:FlaA1/EpsC-like NDP-sugar epimerase